MNVASCLETTMTKAPTLTPFERLLTAKETATLLGVSLSWLAKARLRGDGPLFIKIGRAVRYPESAIRDYLKARTRTSTSER
jgi:predicted DNA-binding transcriptional regulator AlpA